MVGFIQTGMGDFYGTGIEIWTGFGPIGSIEKRGLGKL